jgi:hypothetical protein
MNRNKSTTIEENVENEKVASEHYGQKIEELGEASGNVSLDLGQNDTFVMELAGDVTFSFERTETVCKGGSTTLFIKQDSQKRTISYPQEVQWDNGSKPSDPSADGELEVTLVTYDDGETYKARETGRAFS